MTESNITDNKYSNIIEKLLFPALILLEIFFLIYLIINKRCVGGHDGFQYFSLQYYFLNNVVTAHQIPQWLPFMTHGTVATWWYIIQGGLLQNVLLLTGGLLKSINFFYIFNIGIFLDKLVLIVGVWLLSRRYYESIYTAFYVSMTVMLSCIWMLQPWYNFHFYYALPLIIFFYHKFLDSGKWLFFFLGSNLLLMQLPGNLPYFIPIISLIIFLYFLYFFLFNYKVVSSNIKKIKFDLSFLLYISILLVLALVIWKLLYIGTDELMNYNYRRNLDGQTNLNVFLTYAESYCYRNWLELFLSISPVYDYTIYIGCLALPLFIFGLFTTRFKTAHLVLLIISLFLIYNSSPLASFFYYVWPLMKFYRHLVLIIPFIKLFICFIAGFGFDNILINNFLSRKNPLIRYVWSIVTSLILGALCLHLYLINHPVLAEYIISQLVNDINLHVFYFSFDFIATRLQSVLIYSAFSFIIFLSLRFSKPKYQIIFIFFTLAINLLDLSSYNIVESSLRTSSIAKSDLLSISQFQYMPYAKRRDLTLEENNPRLIFIDNLKVPLARYWSNHSFLFKDQANNPYRTDHWLRPLDKFMRTYWHQSIDDILVHPKGLFPLWKLEFPQEHPAARITAGIDDDKIQFFTKAYPLTNDIEISSYIASNDYEGDNLFISADGPIKDSSQAWDPLVDTSTSKKIHLPYEIIKFDSNNLYLEVGAPDNFNKIWLLYSDVWHPFWKVRINGKSQKIYRGNLAYKAVELLPGENKIHFSLFSKYWATLQYLIGINSLFWIITIIFFTVKLCRNP